MKIYEMRAFPATEFGGNKAGVVLQSDHLTEEEMQFFAKEVGYSETAFVSLSRVADFKVRFFTPFKEVDLCGHATIATFNLMRDIGMITPGTYRQETKAGILRLDVRKDMVYMEQAKPQEYGEVSIREVEQCFNKRHFVSKEYPCAILSTGLRELFVPVKSVEMLNELKMFKRDIIGLCIKHHIIGLHLFTFGTDCDAYSRNFAPIVGIDEESATGTSNGALGYYFSRYVGIQHNFVFRQGYAMNEPSELYVTIVGNKKTPEEVWVGGKAIQIKTDD